MNFLTLGFFTSLSLILALGAQNVFVIEQGLKKQYIFLVCLVCSLSDLILIFFGIFLFYYFNQYFNSNVELIFNILLLIFLAQFIFFKIKQHNAKVNIDESKSSDTILNIFIKTLGFTYLNPHVYSDTVFFLGNFSKSFLLKDKIYFGIGASIASFLFFFTIGYLSKFLSKYILKKNIWRIINLFIITFMSLLSFYVFLEILTYFE
tara:strand:- start:450 stop:1067 length:618 start_codon:yes stop_codon:yes gene_type:complete